MKKFFVGLMLLLLFCGGAWADVVIDAANFPDATFRAYVTSYDVDSNGELSAQEIEAVTGMYLTGRGISSLKGIEYFTNLTALNFGNNYLTSVDLSSNTKLTSLYCHDNPFTVNLDLSKNTALTELSCGNAQLTALDLSNNKALVFLECNDNQFTTLDLSNNTALRELSCGNAQLTTLDVSKNTSLVRLVCSYNSLKSLNLSKNVSLDTLYCVENQLVSLDLGNNIYLRGLWCSNNKLVSLDVSKNVSLDRLYCWDNQLKTLDLSNNISLRELNCYDNELTRLDLSKNTALESLNCFRNQLTFLNVSGLEHLTTLTCAKNQLTTLDVSSNVSLDSLSCNGNQLTTLDVSHNIALVSLACEYNQLATLDLSGNTSLDIASFSYQTVSPLIITSSSSTSYPYQLDLNDYMSPDKFANISGDIKAYDSVSNDIEAYYSNGIVMFVSEPSSVVYNYKTGDYGRYGTTLMNVIIGSASSTNYYDQADGDSWDTAYPISSVNDLLLLQERLNNGEEPDGKYYALTTSIDMTSLTSSWYGIGRDNDPSKSAESINHPFTGHFDGKGYTITVAFDYAGLFGVLSADEGTIAVRNLNLTGTTHYSPLAFALISGIVEGCSFTGTVSTNVIDAAGLISYMFGGIIRNCYVLADISSSYVSSWAGGIVASMGGGTITECTVRSGSTITARYDAGGIVGIASGGTITNCKVENGVTLSGANNGGVVGYDESDGSLLMSGNSFPGIYAGTSVAIDSSSFPDAIFREYVKDNFDDNGNGVLSGAELASVTIIEVPSRDIGSLQGIEYFIHLTSLDCDTNLLTTIDVSNNTELTMLACGNNRLSALDVGSNLALRALYCDSNDLSALDVSKNTALTVLAVGSNRIATLDVGSNKLLRTLHCYDNNLTGLDVSKNLSLDVLGCFSNDLGTLDISKNTALTVLWCWDNGLSELDVSNNTALEELSCFNNQLTELDVSKNLSLTTLNCGSNKLTVLDISKNSALVGLSCEDNMLTSLDVRSNPLLEGLACWSNDLTELDVSRNVNLSHLDCNTNRLKTIDLSNNPNIGYFDCRLNRLTVIDLGSHSYSYPVFCYSQDVTPLYITYDSTSSLPYKLDLSRYVSSDKLGKISGDIEASGYDGSTVTVSRTSGIAAFSEEPAKVTYYYTTSYDLSVDVYLTTMDVTITEAFISPSDIEVNEANFPDANFRAYVSSRFDINGNGWLSEGEIARATDIICSQNEISSLQGIEYFTSMTYLHCGNNQLTTLDLSRNTALISVDCSYNQLTSLDVKSNTELRYLHCESNYLKTIDVSNNRALRYLYCDLNQLTGLDVSSNTELLELACYQNKLAALDLSRNTKLTSLQCYAQTLYSPDITATGSEQYPYRLDFSKYMTSSQYANISALSANDSNGNAIEDKSSVNLVSDGYVLLSSYPAKVSYYYNTGYNSMEMDVTIDNSNGTLPGDVVLINGTNFPDQAFRDYLTETYDTKGYGTLSLSTLSSITSLNVNGKGISSLEGLSYFTGLTELHCGNNSLTTLDVRSNEALTFLDCSGNQLTELDVSQNKALRQLDCSDNRLTALDVSSNTALGGLYCEGNQLTVLDVSNNRNLLYLYCSNNQLTELDVSKNTELEILRCYSNLLTVLDLSTNTDLTMLECSSQDTSPLTLTGRSGAYRLDLSNYVSSDKVAKVLGVQGFTSKDAEISTNYSNGIATLTSYPSKVKYYYDTGYSSTSMDVTISESSDSTGSVAVNSTNFPDSTFRDYVSRNLDLNGDGSLSVSEIKLATQIVVYGMGISSLQGIEYFTALVSLECGGNQLTTLDVSNNTLGELRCNDNQLTTLSVGNVAGLNCNNNQLTTLDLSNSTGLEWLYCDNNRLTALNVSQNTALFKIHCDNNQLTTLNLSSNTALEELRCASNRFTTLSLSANTALTTIDCRSQDVSGFTVNGIADPDYPYQLNFSTYITAANISNISGVQALNSSGANITTTYSNGIGWFAARPSRVRYNYNTGRNNTLMNVTAAVSIEEYVPPAPAHDEAILSLVSRGLLDENYRPRITFGGEGNNFSGDFVKGAVLTRSVSLGFKAQTWNVYINGQSVKILSASSFGRGGVRAVEVADGITIIANEDGTGASIRVNTNELDNGNNNIQLGVVPDGGTEETALVDLGTVTVSNPPRQAVSADVPVVMIEEATITPVVLSEDVIQRLADSVSVDRSEIIMLTSDDFDPGEAPEPTEQMKQVARQDNVSLVAKLNTVSVRQDGWYAFQVTVSDDLIGTSVKDLRIYAAEEEDFMAGELRASFAFLPVLNGITGGFEIHNLLGIKLDTVPKQFLAVVFLSAGKSLTMYIGKILLMLLVGCSAAGGLGVVAVLGVFLIRRYRKK